MKNATPRIDRDKKTIYATKSFLIKAGQFGTTEFNTLNDMLKTLPGFKVEEEKIARNASKEVYGDLTYKVMKAKHEAKKRKLNPVLCKHCRFRESLQLELE